MIPRTAVVLFNLGGPDSPAAVRPFLYNLFNDPAILGLPRPFRSLLALLISRRRTAKAQAIYAHMGGRSPILPQTEAQGQALAQELGEGFRVFPVMRYWHPRAEAVVREVKAWGAERIVLLPLYPQFSTTTTASSLAEWQHLAARAGVFVPTKSIGCYYSESGWIAAIAALIRSHCPDYAARRLLFSAHGLPEKIVKNGDPYQQQVENTVAAVVQALGDAGLDAVTCYQSRVGPLQWIGPSTDEELRRAGRDGKAVTVIPIAFVSEHSETLVELDIEYRELAEHAGVPSYSRVPTVQTQPAFIAGLARLVQQALAADAPAVLCAAKQRCTTASCKAPCHG